MSKYRYLLVGGILALVAAGLFGFYDYQEKVSIGDQIVVTALGIDKNENEISLSVQAVDALKTASNLSEQSQTATGVYEAKGASINNALESFLNESGRSTYLLHNKLIAVGENALKDNSLYEVLDFFLRNAECSSLVDVVVCRSNPHELLSIQSQNDAIEAEYVARMLKEGARLGVAVRSTLLNVQQTAGGDYDVALPILRVEEGTPRLDGTLLFRNGQAVGELNTEETTALLYAADQLRSCSHTINGVTLQVTSLRTHLSFGADGSCHLKVKGKASVTESEKRLTQAQKEQQLQRFETEWGKQIQAVLEKVTGEYGSDPLAFGRRAAIAVKPYAAEDSSFFVTVDMCLKENNLVK